MPFFWKRMTDFTKKQVSFALTIWVALCISCFVYTSKLASCRCIFGKLRDNSECDCMFQIPTGLKHWVTSASSFEIYLVACVAHALRKPVFHGKKKKKKNQQFFYEWFRRIQALSMPKQILKTYLLCFFCLFACFLNKNTFLQTFSVPGNASIDNQNINHIVRLHVTNCCSIVGSSKHWRD